MYFWGRCWYGIPLESTLEAMDVKEAGKKNQGRGVQELKRGSDRVLGGASSEFRGK